MGRHKLIVETELSDNVESFSVNNEKASITQLSGKNLNHFVGNSYGHSLQLAFDWMEEKNNDKKCFYIVEMIDYFRQIMGGKSILVSYNITYR